MIVGVPAKSPSTHHVPCTRNTKFDIRIEQEMRPETLTINLDKPQYYHRSQIRVRLSISKPVIQVAARYTQRQ